jgi:hypothetical protein
MGSMNELRAQRRGMLITAVITAFTSHSGHSTLQLHPLFGVLDSLLVVSYAPAVVHDVVAALVALPSIDAQREFLLACPEHNGSAWKLGVVDVLLSTTPLCSRATGTDKALAASGPSFHKLFAFHFLLRPKTADPRAFDWLVWLAATDARLLLLLNGAALPPDAQQHAEEFAKALAARWCELSHGEPLPRIAASLLAALVAMFTL